MPSLSSRWLSSVIIGTPAVAVAEGFADTLRICLPLHHCSDLGLKVFIIFFTRAFWTVTVALSTIAFFLITSRIESGTTFDQAFQRSDKIARCALHRTLQVAGWSLT